MNLGGQRVARSLSTLRSKGCEYRPITESLETRTLLAAAFPEFVDPNPNPGNQFGAQVVPLSTGNVVITSPGDDAGGVDAGAVYLFNGATGALISTLTGSTANDNLGNGGITALGNGNYLVNSPDWDNGAATNAGAVTFGSGTTGVSGVVDASNSLVGSTANDRVGTSVTVLTNGNYVVRSRDWDNGAVTDAGAVTFGDGTTGVSGVISAGNSLVGSSAADFVGGNGVTVLSSGNYLVNSAAWDNGVATDAGAVTFGSGTTGVSGVVDASNSLVGASANDRIGGVNVTLLANGNYLVRSQNWDNGVATDAGAVTFGSGTTGVSGVVSASNSLVGSTANDLVGSSVIELTNGNYVVRSTAWDNGAVTDAGAVTFGDGTTGVSGVVSAGNSLVGSSPVDVVGGTGIVPLPNGNYLVRSSNWDNGAATGAGAVTFGSGTTGVSGVISASNSLVGSSAGDSVGDDAVVTLTNGNYVVRSQLYDNGAATNAGAVTFGSGATGVSGVVSASNSLVGSSAEDRLGNITPVPLSNGNYVVRTPTWDNGAVTDVGAVTFGDGTTGVSGVVSASNSLVGSSAGDQIGSFSVTGLSNGNYVVSSPVWNNGTVIDAGAVTFANGTTGITGVVSAGNSLVGSSLSDLVGLNGITPLSNGNYVVLSNMWNNGAVTTAGAVTFGDGTTGVSGVVDSSNSLVGSTVNDRIGNLGITELSNGNYVVRSTGWDNGAVTDAGAVTFGSGTTGVSGAVSASNSLVGSTASDQVGVNGITLLTDGNYLVRSQNWDNGVATDAGALTFGSGTTGVSGVVGATNSLVGSTANDRIGNFGITVLSNGNFVVRSRDWDNGGATDAGAVTFGSRTTGVSGVVSASNSLVGSTASDQVGGNGITLLTNGNYLVRSTSWDNGVATDAGAVTFGSGTTGVSGVVSASNSLVGSSAGDSVSDFGVIALSNGNYVVTSRNWDNGATMNAGAVTFGDGTTGVSGEVSAMNSLVGTTTNSSVQTTIVDEANEHFLARFRDEDNGKVRLGSLTSGIADGAPTVSLTGTTTTLPENTVTSPAVKVADIVITGNALGTNVLSLTGADAALFQIVGTELFLVDGAALDFETNPALDVTVNVNDAAIAPDPNDTADLSISITDVNERPTLALANTQATANIPGPPVRLTTNATFTDPDSTNLNGVRAIVQFDSAWVSLDRLWLLDDNGQRLSDGNALTIGGVNVGTVLRSQYGVNVLFNTNATAATLQTVFNRIEYQSLSQVGTPEFIGPRTIEFLVVDAGYLSASKLFTLDTQRVNVGPQLSLANNQATANIPGPGVRLTTNATVADPDAANFNGARAIVQFNSAWVSLDRLWLLDDKGERLSDGNALIISGVNVGTVLRSQYGVHVLFNANATAATVRTVFNRIEFQSLSTVATPERIGPRTLEFRVLDSEYAATSMLFTLNIQRINTAPQLSLGNTQGAATLPGPAVTLTSNATFSDPDAANLNGVRAIVQFNSAWVSLDRLWLLDDNGQRLSDGNALVIGGTNVGTVVRSQYGVQVLFNANATATTVRTVFNRIQYQSLATMSSPERLGQRSLDFLVVDADGASTSRLFTLNVS